MERFLGRIVLALCFCMFLAATGHGKQLRMVFLKDGGVIDCQKFWKENGKVMVLVNRDVLVDLSQDEVDMKRTFRGHKASKSRKPAAAKHKVADPVVPVNSLGSKPEVKTVPAEPSGARQKAMTSAVKQASGTVAMPKGQGSGDAKNISPAAKSGASVPGAPKPVPKPPSVVPAVKSPPSAGPALAGMLGMGTLLPFLLLLVLLIASFWKVFTKAGEAGWQSIVPLYNMFILVKISGKPWWWFLLMFIPVVGIIVLILVQMALAARFNRGPLFGLGLAFLGFIFYPVLAFDKSSYQ